MCSVALIDDYSEIQIARMCSFSFHSMTDEVNKVVVKRINETKPSFMWGSFGIVKQETWKDAYQERVNGLMVSVGFD